MMNWYATKMMADQRRNELLQEAHQERIAHMARGHAGNSSGSGSSLPLKLAFTALAVLLALLVAGPTLYAAV